MHQPRFPRIGEIFVGRYQIERVIGSGGFSQVYLATQTDLGRPVAIKVLKSVFDPKKTEAERQRKFEQTTKRFEREAKLISRLKDRNTVMMYDYGATGAGLLFMVLEYVEGLTINELLHRDGALAPDRVVKIISQALSSLHEAHTLGVLHRDIKPGNIMVYDHVGRSDLCKVLDFGIAKSVDIGDGSNHTTSGDVTADGVLVGTPRYMSPEQIRGKSLSAASDIYSLGLVAYEMLMGTKAVDADSSLRIIARHLDTDPISLPPSMNLPPRLRTIINKMLIKDPVDRYQSCEEVLSELESWDADVIMQGVQDATMTVDPSGVSVERSVAKAESSGSGNRMVLVGIVALVLVIAGLVGAPMVLRDDGGTDTAEAAQPTGVADSEADQPQTNPVAVADPKPKEADAPAADEHGERMAKSLVEIEQAEAAVAKAKVDAEEESEAADEPGESADEKADEPEAKEQPKKVTKRRKPRRRSTRSTKDERKSDSDSTMEPKKQSFKPFALE